MTESLQLTTKVIQWLSDSSIFDVLMLESVVLKTQILIDGLHDLKEAEVFI